MCSVALAQTSGMRLCSDGAALYWEEGGCYMEEMVRMVSGDRACGCRTLYISSSMWQPSLHYMALSHGGRNEKNTNQKFPAVVSDGRDLGRGFCCAKRWDGLCRAVDL